MSEEVRNRYIEWVIIDVDKRVYGGVNFRSLFCKERCRKDVTVRDVGTNRRVEKLKRRRMVKDLSL